MEELLFIAVLSFPKSDILSFSFYSQLMFIDMIYCNSPKLMKIVNVISSLNKH